MKEKLKNQYLTALDVCVVALHWAAAPWETIAPGVAAHIRRIANGLAEKAALIRSTEPTPPRGTRIAEAEERERTEISEVPTPTTDVVTQVYGDRPPKK